MSESDVSLKEVGLHRLPVIYRRMLKTDDIKQNQKENMLFDVQDIPSKLSLMSSVEAACWLCHLHS